MRCPVWSSRASSLEPGDHPDLLAAGALAETFVDDGSRGMFCAPRRDSEFAVEAIRRRIAIRAACRGQDEHRPGTAHTG